MEKIKLTENFTIRPGGPVFFIADIGANHNGSLLKAKRLIDLAAKAGVNAVKFQSYRADYLMNKKYHPEGYKLIRKYQFPMAWNGILKKYSERRGLCFLTTPFDVETVSYLEDLDVAFYKIASSDITFCRLIDRIGKTGKPVVLSTGGAEINEIKNAVEILKKTGNKRIVLLHTIVNYPCAYDEVNLSFMPVLGEKFKVPFGLSDHTLGTEVSIAAVAYGASVIEKHFTDNRRQKGPDHIHSMEPAEFKNLVIAACHVKSSVGEARKIINLSEKKRLKKARRAFYAVKDICRGEIFNGNNVRELRPGGEIAADKADIIFGKKAKKAINNYEMIRKKDIL
ncbi:N-acetylneuraminate synthase family protein [bacterium]|jgi:sialic acid synthase SpsE|nr:N-acetylneuraminate synthase family protein [bacterium]